jgi:hypothetical protein
MKLSMATATIGTFVSMAPNKLTVVVGPIFITISTVNDKDPFSDIFAVGKSTIWMPMPVSRVGESLEVFQLSKLQWIIAGASTSMRSSSPFGTALRL